MTAIHENFPLRTHHLDFAFSMAVTLDKLNKKDIQLSEVFRTVLFDEFKLNYDDFTDDDVTFLGLLAQLAWKIREGSREMIKKQSDYNDDVIGKNSDSQEKYIDLLTLASIKSIIAIFLPHTVIQIGDVLDGHCLTCAVGQHCLEYKNDDLAILIQLQNFIAGKSTPTPNASQLKTARIDQTQLISAETIKAFLFDRADSVVFDKLDHQDEAILLSKIYRALLISRKRVRTN